MDALLVWMRDKLEARHHKQVLKKFGMTTKCTYCNQIMQDGCEFKIQEHPSDKRLDLLTCSNCKGISVWLFAPVWIYISGWQPPAAKHKPQVNAKELS